MACAKLYIIIAAAALLFPVIISSKQILVGDETGWTINFDYEAWAKGKEFKVGDKLVFKYPEGDHDVFKVNGTCFKNCIKPPANEALTTGNDVIRLATPGNKWYICGVGQHCKIGNQKLTITVLARTFTSSSEHGSAFGLVQLVMVAAISMVIISIN